MNIHKFLLILATISIHFFQFSHAQRKSNYFSFGPTLGVTNYKGDLDDNNTLKFTKPGGGFVANYHFNPHMFLRVSFVHGRIGAVDSLSSDAKRRNRNLSFKSVVNEFSTQLVYDFFGNFHRTKFRPFFTPYIFAGIAVFRYNPQAELNGKTYDLQPIGTEGQYLKKVDNVPKPYSLTQIAIPFGGGFRFAIAEKWDLAIEMGARKLFTDYLDDVSDRYVDPQEMLKQQGVIAMQLSDRSAFTNFGTNYSNSGFRENVTRGFKNQKDWYFYTGIILTHVIEAKDNCPKK